MLVSRGSRGSDQRFGIPWKLHSIGLLIRWSLVRIQHGLPTLKRVSGLTTTNSLSIWGTGGALDRNNCPRFHPLKVYHLGIGRNRQHRHRPRFKLFDVFPRQPVEPGSIDSGCDNFAVGVDVIQPDNARN